MKIYALNTLEMGVTIADILRRDVSLAGMIGLTKRKSTDKISGYMWMQPYCQKQGLDFIGVDTYSLSKMEDRERLLGLGIDCLVIAGWQRVIPSWLIDHCQFGVIGIHGSAYGITRGRGRSPQNWALLLGEKRFSVSIFEVDAGIDSGRVLATEEFALESWDDIKTSHYKTGRLAGRMIAEYINGGGTNFTKAAAQVGQPAYLPQRLPEDGEIDWFQSSVTLYDFVRALTRPYPGAFSAADGKKVTIWRGRPLELEQRGTFVPGEIVAVYPNGDFLVRTGTGYFLVEDYVAEGGLMEGTVLSSTDLQLQLTGIIKRHSVRYPALPVSAKLKDAAFGAQYNRRSADDWSKTSEGERERM